MGSVAGSQVNLSTSISKSCARAVWIACCKISALIIVAPSNVRSVTSISVARTAGGMLGEGLASVGNVGNNSSGDSGVSDGGSKGNSGDGGSTLSGVSIGGVCAQLTKDESIAQTSNVNVAPGSMVKQLFSRGSFIGGQGLANQLQIFPQLPA